MRRREVESPILPCQASSLVKASLRRISSLPPRVVVATRCAGLARCTPPSPGTAPQTACGVTTVTPRRGYGVVPMGSDPHGNHTGISPGRHRCHTGTAGWEPGIGGGGRKGESRPADESGNSRCLRSGQYRGVLGSRWWHTRWISPVAFSGAPVSRWWCPDTPVNSSTINGILSIVDAAELC
jgi:hypothetical protein